MIGIVAAAAATTVLVVVLIHKTRKTAITGCVKSGENGTITDEKDRQIYALSANTTGIKPGNRMKVQGKGVKSKGPERRLVWEAKAVTKDLGVCQS